MAPKKSANQFTEFDKEFAAISLKGEQVDEAYAKAEYSTYAVLVNAYLFHRKVRDNKEYLKRKYEEAGIRENVLEGNKINFRPFIRITFRLDIPNMPPEEKLRKSTIVGSERVRIAHYKIIFDAFEEQWDENPDSFQTGAFEKLLGYLENHSMNGIITEYKDKQQAKKTKNTADDEKEVEETRKKLADIAFTNIIENAPVVAAAPIEVPEQLQYNSERLAACLCRINDATGEIEIIATSNDELAMRLIAQSNIAKLEQIGSQALRTLAEVVATQSFPSKHIPGGNRDKLTGALKNWYHTVYLETSPVKGHLQTQRRLVLRGHDILLSAQRTDSSVVTILKKPAYKLIPSNAKAVFLKTELLRKIEEWLENKTIAARTSEPANKLGRPTTKTTAAYVLHVTNTATKAKQRTLYFYDVFGKDQSLGQVDFNEADFVPTWSFGVSKNWLMRLRAQLLDPWFELAASGRKLKRPENSIYEIKITPTQFKISYEIDGSDEPPTETFKLNPPATFAQGKSIAVTVRTKDAAPALSNLADFPIVGEVKFSGNASVLVIEFATDLGSYLIAIPTLHGAKLTRDKTQFKVYAAWDKANDQKS